MGARVFPKQTDKETLNNWQVPMLAWDDTTGVWRPPAIDTNGAIAVTATTTAASAGYSAQTPTTRPNDTAAYSAGDVLGVATNATSAITFANIGPASGFIEISDADLRIDISAIPAGMTSFRLHLYNVTPPSAIFDNVAWDLPAGDRASYLGYIDLGTPVVAGSSTLFAQTNGLAVKRLAMGATTSLFGYLVTNGGYTPAANTVRAIRLSAKGI